MANKIYLLNGSKVWLDPETAPAEAIPLSKTKKVEPVKEPEQKAKPATANKAKKATANKAKTSGGTK